VAGSISYISYQRPLKDPISYQRPLKDPQYSSYVIPLLIEEGFCDASESQPYKIMKQNKDKM